MILEGFIIRLRKIGDAPVYLLTAGVQSLSPLVLLPLQRLLLGLDDLGMVILASSVSGFTGLLATMGVADAVLRRRLSGDVSVGEAMRIVKTVPVVALPTSILVALILGFSGLNTSDVSELAIVIGALSGVAVCTLLVCQQSVRADSRPWSYLLNVIFWQFLSPLVGLVMVLFGFGITGYLGGWAAALLVGALWAIYSAIGPHRPFGEYRESLFSSYSQSVRLGFPILLHSLAGSAILLVDRSFLASVHGGRDVAIYQAIFLLGQASGMVLSAFNNSWAVRLFKTDYGHRWQRQRQDIGALAYAVAALIGGLMVVVLPVFQIMMGGHVDPRWTLAAVIAMSSLGITQILYLAGMNSLYFNGRTGDLAKITLPCAVSQSLISVLLIPKLGFLGPCIAILCVQTLQSIFVWFRARAVSDLERIPRSWWFAGLPVWMAVVLIAFCGIGMMPIAGAVVIVLSLFGLGMLIRRRELVI